MDSQSPSIDFAVIGHQDSWQTITTFMNAIRKPELQKLSAEDLQNIFSFIPACDLFRVKVKSKLGKEINGVYIETFIAPDKLDTLNVKSNINKVIEAINLTKKLGAKIVALGGFTSIVLEGNIGSFSTVNTQFTTGNTLTAAYILKGVERASNQYSINLLESNVLIIGATGDIGIACTHYLKNQVKKLLLCARNNARLEKLTQELDRKTIDVSYSTNLQDLIPEADIVISVASSSGLKIEKCRNNVLICDAGYPKNFESSIDVVGNYHLFHGGMGYVSAGFECNPDYSQTTYHFAAPHIIHGCILEAMILAFEHRYESFSIGKGLISMQRIEDIYQLSLKHGITLAPFYNTKGPMV